MTDKLYADRDIMSLDMKGNYYCKHVVALTRENLVGKSEIAAELAYRDYTIDQLQKKLDKANQRISMLAWDFLGGAIFLVISFTILRLIVN